MPRKRKPHRSPHFSYADRVWLRKYRLRLFYASLGFAMLVVGGWFAAHFALHRYRLAKLQNFEPLAVAFLARGAARDTASLRNMTVDSAAVRDVLKLPPQILADIRSSLRIVDGIIEGDFARVEFQTTAALCPTVPDHIGSFQIQFIEKGSRWLVERAEPSMC